MNNLADQSDGHRCGTAAFWLQLLSILSITSAGGTIACVRSLAAERVFLSTGSIGELSSFPIVVKISKPGSTDLFSRQ